MTISFLTPSFNQSKYIGETIDSIHLGSNIKRFEHIILDCLSNDGTDKVIKKKKRKFKIRYIRQKDKGQADALNKGLKIAKHEIIGWINSDDLYCKNIFKKVIKIFQDNPEIDIVYGKGIHINEKGKKINFYPTKDFKGDFYELKKSCWICQPATFFRKKIIKKIGFLDIKLKYCMDYDFWMKAAKKKIKFYYLDETLALSRLHSNNKTLSFKREVHDEINQMLIKKYGSTNDQWIMAHAHASIIDKKKSVNKHFFFLLLIIQSIFSSWKFKKTSILRFLINYLKIVFKLIIFKIRKLYILYLKKYFLAIKLNIINIIKIFINIIKFFIINKIK